MGSMIEEQGHRQTVAVKRPDRERRKSPRTSIRRLAYVNLDPYDNGGVITDISKEGLRFHMVNPVEHGGLVRLSLLLGATNQIQVVGETIWMDSTRKIGGVRFTVLPEGAVDQILCWAEAANSADRHQSDSSPRSQRVHESPIPNPARPPQPAAIPPPQAAAEPNARPPWVPPSARHSPGADAPRMPSSDSLSPDAAGGQPRITSGRPQQPTAIPPVMPPAMPWITHFDPDPPARKWSFVPGVLTGFVLCTLLGSAALLAFRNNDWRNFSLPFDTPATSSPVASNPLASPSAELPSRTDPDIDNPASPQASPSGSQAIPSPATPKARPGLTTQVNPSTEAAEDAAAASQSAAAPEVSASPRNPSPQAPIAELTPPTALPAERGSPAPAPQQTAKSPASQPPRSADAGESQLLLARRYLDGRVQPRNPTVASQLLWSAVEKGNSAAEMDLADLYLRGDGITRNCDQARVLLSAASEKGNAEAMQKLRELNRAGCR